MKNQQAVTRSLVFGPKAAASATASVNIDTKGGHYLTVELAFGPEINTNAKSPTLTFSHSDDTVVTNFATWNADLNRAVDLTADGTVSVTHIYLHGGVKRYVKCLVTPGTAASNDAVIYSGVAIIDTEIKPSDNDDTADEVVVV
jgi:hypothetical protein